MQRFLSRISVISLLLLSVHFSNLPAFSQAAQDRIVQPIEAGKMSALSGTVPPLARAEYDRGPVDSALPLHGMSLDFTPSAAQQAELAALLKAQQDPSSPSYHRWLTTEQYAQRFGMTSSDIAKATAWLQSQGFTIDHVDENRNAIRFSGTAAMAQAAFHTQIHKFAVNGETHFANATAVSLPSALASSVVHVGGLNDFKLKPMLVRPSGTQRQRVGATAVNHAVTGQFTTGTGGDHTGSHFLAPGDYAVIYDTAPLIAAGDNGTGQSIGVIGQANIVLSDITAFRTNAGLSTNNPTIFVIPNSTPGNDYNSGDINESELDLEWAGGVAPAANIVFVNSGDVFTSLQYAIANKIGGVQLPILTMSYGGCEAAQGSGAIASLESSLKEANAQGQTILNSSGDTGAAACDDGSTTPATSATQGLAVNYPASSAYVTGVGGSEFMGDGSAESPSYGSDQYWSANGNNDLLTSAISYIPEMTWNDTTFNLTFPDGGLSAGGGGASSLFSKPSWQTGVAGIPADGLRDVPDVSLTASADHDGYLICTQIILASDTNQNPTNADYTGSCANGFRISDSGYDDDQTVTVYGGTSASTPSFAGILALIEQKLGVAGMGNINPSLYSLASNASTYGTAFHDITTGNNMVPCTAGSTDCPSSGELGYDAAAGYDQATGLGSVDANNLATALASTAVQTGTATAISVSPAAPTVGETVSLTASVTPSSGTGVPTGTVIFTIDGVAGTAVAMSSGAATTTTDFSTGGTHTVIAAYSGDTNYYASTTTSTISVGAAPTAAPTTTVLAASPTTIALYGSITLTATVSSTTAGTVAGTVDFNIGTTLVGTAQVVAGASGTGTATLSVTSATPALGFTSPSTAITAAYGGDSSYASSSGSTTVAVTNPGISMTVSNMTISGSSPGNSGTSTITVTSSGGYSGTVNLTATAPSLNASYGFGSSNAETASLAIPSGGSASTTIAIETVAASLSKSVGGNFRHATTARNRVIAGAVAAFGCIFLLGIPGFRKRRWPMLTALLALGALSAGLGCGGGGSSGASPSGTYTVTVTATDSVNSAITTSTNFTVTIQ